MKYLHERRKALGGYLPKRRAAPDEQLHGARAGDLQGRARAHRRGPRDQHHAGLCALPDAAAARQGAGPARRAHPGGRGAHLRHGRPVPPDRHLQPRGPEVHAGRQGPGDVLPRGQGRPDPAGGHQRGRRHGSWIAAATSYSTNNRIMVPFYIYYSMFGFQRIGDLAWAAGDMQARGFLLGGTSGRTTLNGEGLQHEDGHSHILAGTIPNCVSYDPTFAHEVAVILHHGLKRMVEQAGQRLLLPDPAQRELPDARPEARHRGADHQGHVPARGGRARSATRQPAGQRHDPAREHGGEAELLEADWGVAANVWSCPSFNELARDGQDCERWNLLHPTASRACAFVAQQLARMPARWWRRTDYMKNYAEQIRAFVPRAAPTRCWAPTASAAATSAAAARALRDQPPLHRGGRAQGAGRRRRGAAAKVAEAIAKYGIDADKSTRCTPEAGTNPRPDMETMAFVEVKVPDIGDFKDVAVIELLVKPGDTVKAEQSAAHRGATRRRWRSRRRMPAW
jgi:pyruvate dehydrogenase E1 component